MSVHLHGFIALNSEMQKLEENSRKPKFKKDKSYIIIKKKEENAMDLSLMT